MHSFINSTVSLAFYADDMNPSASHTNYKTAEKLLQPYLQDIYNWTQSNNLILNPTKYTSTFYTPDTHEHNDKLSPTIIDVVIPTIRNPKIIGLTLDPAFNFSKHVKITKK